MAFRPSLPAFSNQFRLFALLHTGRTLSLAFTFGLALVAIARDNPQWLALAGGTFVVWTVLALFHITEAPRTRCAACSAPLFERSPCALHRDACTTLGGYRLHTALQILGSNQFDCHHCGTHVSCAATEPIPDPVQENGSFRVQEVNAARRCRDKHHGATGGPERM